jgi:hypothetical protein
MHMDLRLLFRLVAGLELAYAIIGLMPPGWVASVTGWQLSPDGQWITKLLAVALLSQALVAWTLRDRPDLGVALALAVYQLLSATADWVMWIVLADDGVFASTTAKALVIAAIPSHYVLGLLLLRAIRAEAAASSEWAAAGATSVVTHR